MLSWARNSSGQPLSLGHRAAETCSPPSLPRKELLNPTNVQTTSTSSMQTNHPIRDPEWSHLYSPTDQEKGAQKSIDRGLPTTLFPKYCVAGYWLFVNRMALSGLSLLQGISQKTGLGVCVVHVTPIRKQ